MCYCRKNFNNMKKNLFIIGLLALSCFFFKKANACSDSATFFLGMTSNFKGGINFVGVKYTYGTKTKTSTWLYEVYVDSKSPDLSHLNIQLGGCLPSSMFSSGGTWSGTLSSPTLNSNSCWSIGKDASDPTKMYGIKYDCQLNKGGSYKIYFVLKSDYGVTSNTVKMKAGTTHDSSKICGPDLYCGPVPVTWLTFYGKNDGKKNILYWSTASELHNHFFTIKRSKDGNIWETVGTVAGSGTSNQINHYSFEDNKLQDEKVWFYTVTQTDFDGKNETFDHVIKITSDKSVTQAKIYPNPSQSSFKISVTTTSSSKTKIEILDVVGRKVFQTSFTGENTSIDIENFLPGEYTLILYSGETVISSQKIIKK